ncbi:MAG TPA: hypothetical protein VK445_03960 [Dissulfurispiraceae bacterium]|nr:hypothetical protein [Dissulfurispiraceae bacterium]
MNASIYAIRKAVALVLVAVMLFVTACTEYHAQGIGAGALAGGTAGALLDRHNGWRGGVIGAGLGALLGGTLADISVRGTREAAVTNRPVQYRSDNGQYTYVAEPYDQNASTRCKKVRERVFEGDRLVKDYVKEICDSQRYDRGYLN